VTPGHAAALAVALPALGALGVVLVGRRENFREVVTLATTGLTFATLLGLLPAVLAGRHPGLELIRFLPGVSLAFEVEPLGMLFGLLASGLWIVTALYSIGYLRALGERHQTRFHACFALAISATLGLAFSGNLVTLFLFYEAITFSTYPLVTHHGTPEAVRAGRVYLGILVGTSVALFLLAILCTWRLAGSLDFREGGFLAGTAGSTALALLFVLYVFGIGKAAVMPFHRWLPAAMVAPTPVSALLHAVAVVKAGVFSILKIAIYVFGIDSLREAGSSEWVMYAASFTILAAAIVAIRQDNLKARLAYSTISQLSYIVLGAALATSSGALGAGLHIAMHAMGKITLFFCAGAIYVATHKTEVSQMDGIGRRMPFTMFAFFAASLSVIGLPPFGGVWSKWYLALGAVEGHHLFFLAVLMVGSLLSIGYLMPVVVRAFFREPEPSRDGPDAGPRIREAPLLCLVPLCITAAGCLALFFFAPAIRSMLLPIVGG
jgi:multicomponent Na+:H+ antiporter subunit D